MINKTDISCNRVYIFKGDCCKLNIMKFFAFNCDLQQWCTNDSAGDTLSGGDKGELEI